MTAKRLPKITITPDHGAGDLNALIGDRVVATAFLRPGDNLWRIYSIRRGGSPLYTVTGREVRGALREAARA